MSTAERNLTGTYVFLFDVEFHDFTDSLFEPFCKFLPASPEGESQSFRLRTGALSPHSAYRAVEFQTPEDDGGLGGSYDGGHIRYEGDRAFWVGLMADIADSAKGVWHTFDPLLAPYYLATHDIWILAASEISQSIAESIDRSFGNSIEGYVGAMRIDVGNPVQVQLLWYDQVETFIYDVGHLGLCSNHDEDEYPLAGSDEWWSGLDFKSVFWLRRNWGTGAVVEEELVRTAPYDRSRPLPPDLIPGDISPRGSASRMLFRNGTRLTTVEKVAAAVIEKMTQGETMAPAVTVSVPRAAEAFAQPGRLQNYTLNAEHPRGKEKARLFAAALGITVKDWRYLSDQLTQGLPSGKVMSARVNPDGTMQFHVHIPVLGRNGRTVPVLSAWIIRESRGPELTTAYPAPVGTLVSDPDSFSVPRVIPDFDPSNRDSYDQLYEVAHSSGFDAASIVVPTPVFIGNEIVHVIAEGNFGRAAVIVRDARRGFSRWLIREGRARTRFGRPGAWMPSPAEYPHIDRAEAYARAFADVLQVNGVEVKVETYLR